jgi:HEAT repeat protein
MVTRHALSAVTFPYRLSRRAITGVIPARWRKGKREDARDAFAAWRVADEQGLERLARALADPDPNRRELAMEVICEFSNERASRLLSGMLHDPEPRVRRAAAVNAGRVKATGTVFALILALDDPEPEVREAARRALEAVTGEPVALHGPGDAREAAIEELKARWKQRRFTELAEGR